MDKELRKQFNEKFGEVYTENSPNASTDYYEITDEINAFISKHYISRSKVEKEIDKLLGNCDKALKAGASSEMGSASGGIQLNGCISALKALKIDLSSKRC